MALVDLRLALIPAALFLLLCLVAPFLFRFGFYLPIISRGRTGQRVVALTFDDGPDPATTPHLLRLLAAHDVPATFFVVGQRAAAYPELIRAILDGGHTIGNHSFRHDSLVAFRGPEKIAAEILTAQRVLEGLGVTPMVFRPPVGITYPGWLRFWKDWGWRRSPSVAGPGIAATAPSDAWPSASSGGRVPMTSLCCTTTCRCIGRTSRAGWRKWRRFCREFRARVWCSGPCPSSSDVRWTVDRGRRPALTRLVRPVIAPAQRVGGQIIAGDLKGRSTGSRNTPGPGRRRRKGL